MSFLQLELQAIVLITMTVSRAYHGLSSMSSIAMACSLDSEMRPLPSMQLCTCEAKQKDLLRQAEFAKNVHQQIRECH